MLTGVPDDIFIMADGRYFIWDYKTARFTDNQDALIGMYRVQLNGYALIFEKMGMGKIGGLGLHLIPKMIDSIDYDYADRQSKITFTKALG